MWPRKTLALARQALEMNLFKLTVFRKMRRNAARWDTAIPVHVLSKTNATASNRRFTTLVISL